jgi:protein SCO1/2
MLRVFCFLSLVLSAITASAQATNSLADQKVYPAKGVVVELTPGKHEVTIQHEAIAGYMSAMTMPFDVKDTNELSGLAKGDAVSFRVVVSKNEGWVDQIQKTGAKMNAVSLTNSFHFGGEVAPLNEGDPLPEYRFTNQLGQVISTAQFKGQALAITFLFTRCPFPQYCPLLTGNFAEAQKKLLSLSHAPTNWHLLTISFDPGYDTPEVLQRYAEAHGADAKRWTFATGSQRDVTAIGEQFGLVFWKDGDNGLISHNLRAVVIDASGRVQKIFTGNEWQPADLVSEMMKAAAVPKQN